MKLTHYQVSQYRGYSRALSLPFPLLSFSCRGHGNTHLYLSRSEEGGPLSAFAISMDSSLSINQSRGLWYVVCFEQVRVVVVVVVLCKEGRIVPRHRARREGARSSIWRKGNVKGDNCARAGSQKSAIFQSPLKDVPSSSLFSV